MNVTPLTEWKLCRACSVRLTPGTTSGYCWRCAEEIQDHDLDDLHADAPLPDMVRAADRIMITAVICLAVWVIYELTKGVFAQWLFERMGY